MSLEILANASFSIVEEELREEEDKRSFICPAPDCQREFTSKRNLVDHFRGHHQGAKPHVCEHAGCGKSFLRPAHLLIHNRIHTGEKPFVCEFEGCGKRWNQKSALKQHMRSHTGEKPFVCTVDGCTKSFSTSSSCKRHISTHTKGPETKEEEPVQQVQPIQKRKFPGVLSDSSSDEEYDRPIKKATPVVESSPAIPCRHIGQVADEFARKMALNFILN